MEYNIESIVDLEHIAIELLPKLKAHKKICFYGEMGAGKTIFTKYIAEALGSKNSTSSPTFSLVNEYNYLEENVQKTLVHIDLYRIKNEFDLFESGIEEYLYDDNIVIIEWPQLVEDMIDNPLKIRIEAISDNQRKIVIL